MPRIAIVGSCITRDLWPIRGGGSEALLYISRTSFPSLLAAPLAAFSPAETPPGDLHRHEHNALVADLQKSALGRLVTFAPTHIIFDFIDERFDLLWAAGTLVTHSAELVRSGYLAQRPFAAARPIARPSAACDRLWFPAMEAFAGLLRETPLVHSRLVLHSARWATHQRAPDGQLSPLRDVEILSGKSADIAVYNDLLARQEAAFEAAAGPIARVAAPEHRIADPNHAWGLSPFHYVADYYMAIRRQLAQLGLADAFSGAGDAPSVPAA